MYFFLHMIDCVFLFLFLFWIELVHVTSIDKESMNVDKAFVPWFYTKKKF